MKHIITAALCAAAISANAAELMINGLTYHRAGTYTQDDGTERKYNNVNPGIGYFFDNGVGIGVYQNSYYKTTAYVSYRYMLNDNFGAVVGYGTGYKEHGSGGFIGGLLLRTNDLGSGWRLNLMGNPFGKSAILTLAISKELK